MDILKRLKLFALVFLLASSVAWAPPPVEDNQNSQRDISSPSTPNGNGQEEPPPINRRYHTGLIRPSNPLFRGLQKRIRRGELLPESSILEPGQISPAEKSDVFDPFNFPPHLKRFFESIGINYLREAKAAIFIMAGGKASRYRDGESVVKANEIVVTSELFHTLQLSDLFSLPDRITDLTFLGLKLASISLLQQKLAMSNTKIPVVLWVSRDTEEAIKTHLRNADYYGLDSNQVYVVTHNREMPRLVPNTGDLMHDPNLPRNGNVASVVAGHGAFWPSMAESDIVRSLVQDQQVKTFFITNVDNIFGLMSPILLGTYLYLQRVDGIKMMFELASRLENDKGGLFARVDGKPQIVEGLKLSSAFKNGEVGCLDRIKHFNTNNIYVDTGVFHQPIIIDGQEHMVVDRFTNSNELWHVVNKAIKDESGNRIPVWQLEQLLPDITTILPAELVAYAAVPRGVADDTRFFPVKLASDLESGSIKLDLATSYALMHLLMDFSFFQNNPLLNFSDHGELSTQIRECFKD